MNKFTYLTVVAPTVNRQKVGAKSLTKSLHQLYDLIVEMI